MVRGVSPVQIHDIGDRNGVLVSFEKLYRVAGSDFLFFNNCKVKARPTTVQEPLYNIRAVEANAEFKAFEVG